MSAQDQLPVRVLVVDDSKVFQHVLSAVVAAASGFEVVGAASSGREALHLVDVLDPRLVLMDVHMPDWDGIETARRLRRKHPDLMIVLLSAFARAHVNDPSSVVVDKRELSPSWLADLWQRRRSRPQ